MRVGDLQTELKNATESVQFLETGTRSLHAKVSVLQRGHLEQQNSIQSIVLKQGHTESNLTLLIHKTNLIPVIKQDIQDLWERVVDDENSRNDDHCNDDNRLLASPTLDMELNGRNTPYLPSENSGESLDVHDHGTESADGTYDVHAPCQPSQGTGTHPAATTKIAMIGEQEVYCTSSMARPNESELSSPETVSSALRSSCTYQCLEMSCNQWLVGTGIIVLVFLMWVYTSWMISSGIHEWKEEILPLDIYNASTVIYDDPVIYNNV